MAAHADDLASTDASPDTGWAGHGVGFRTVVVRILIWSLFDSHATIDELRGRLSDLSPPSSWIWSESSERFGLVVFGDELPEAVGWTRDLIGHDPDVYEEFDAP